MRWPNEHDNPDVDQEYHVGETIYYTGSNWRLLMWHTFTVCEIGNSRTDFDYKIETPEGIIHAVSADDITRERPVLKERAQSPEERAAHETYRKTLHAWERAAARAERLGTEQAQALAERLEMQCTQLESFFEDEAHQCTYAAHFQLEASLAWDREHPFPWQTTRWEW
jgi:hypothetical protein